MKNAIASRMAFDNARASLSNAGFNTAAAVLSQSYLRSEVAQSTGSTNFQFPILENENPTGTRFNTEQRLKLQDAFYVSEIGFFIAVPSGVADATFQMFTYPDPSVFTGANTAPQRTWYQGYLQLTVNNRQIVTAWDMQRHLQIQQQQTTANADYTASGINYSNSIVGADDGFVPVEPGLVLVGSKSNQVNIILPAGLAAVPANSRAILIFRGHLAQNVTPVR